MIIKARVWMRLIKTPISAEVKSELGMPPDCFNNMIVSTAVGKSWRPILFVKGPYFGQIRDALFDRGLGKPVWYSPK